jgi:CRP/FNR family transcriptional regulator, nitrogen oxide reductase regulator
VVGIMTPNSAILRRTELFAKLDAATLGDVLRYGRTRRIPRGRIIFHEGETATACHLLLSGRVRIAQSGGGGVVIRYVGPGQIFGALALFHGGRYPADATTLTDCVEIQWSSAAITELMQRYPRIALNALAIVGHRLDELQDRLRELTTEKVDRRIAHALVRLAHQTGNRVERGIEIGFPLSRKDLAAMTGTAHTTVSRILSGWQAQDVITSGRRRIIVRDLRKLEAIAAGRGTR